jgi:hypothetical protein
MPRVHNSNPPAARVSLNNHKQAGRKRDGGVAAAAANSDRTRRSRLKTS